MQLLDIGRLHCNIDEFDFMLRRYSKGFKQDMELAAKFCSLYSKLGSSRTSRIFNRESSDLELDNILEKLETLENPTLEIVDSIFDKFIKAKEASYHGYAVIEDVHIKEILSYGQLEVLLVLT